MQNRVCFKKRFGSKPNKRGRPELPKECDTCGKKFSSRRVLLRHRQLYHSFLKVKYPCGSCPEFFTSPHLLDSHRQSQHPVSTSIYEYARVLRGTCRIYRLDIQKSNVSINSIIPSATRQITDFLNNIIHELHSLKFCLVLVAEYEQTELGGSQDEDVPERMMMHFRSGTSLMLKSDDKELIVRQALGSMENNAESFNVNGSGWNLLHILHINIEVGKCHELAGSCTLHKVFHTRNADHAFEVHDSTPEDKSSKERNQYSGRCFFHAIASYFLNGETDIDKLEAFIDDNIREEGIVCPVRLCDISKFELLNSHLDLGVNVISKSIYKDIYPSYISKIDNPKNIINLLLFYIDIEEPRYYEKSDIEIFKDFDHVEDENNWKLYEKIGISSVRHYALIINFEKELTKARKESIMYNFDMTMAGYEEKIDSNIRLIRRIHELELECTETLFNPFSSPLSVAEARHRLISDARRKKMAIRDFHELTAKKKELDKLHDEYEELYSLDPNKSRNVRVCYNCLSIFASQAALESHKRWCFKESPSVTVLPSPGAKSEFYQKRKHCFSRIQMFFDFECLQVKPEYSCSCRPEYSLKCQDSINNQAIFCKHNTKIESEQKPFYYCLIVCSNEFEILDRVEYYGDDANDHFMETLLDFEIKYMSYLQKHLLPIRFNEQDKEHFERTNICHICKEEIKKNQKKVKDHDHWDSTYLGPGI